MIAWLRNSGWLALLALALPVGAMEPGERLLFANGLYSRGLYDVAIPEYEALVASKAAASLHDLAYFRLGECYRQTGRTNDSAAAYERVLESYPSSAFAQRAAYRRAEIDWQQGRLKDAALRLDALLKTNPTGDVEAASLYFSGTALAGLDRFDDAEKQLRRMLEGHGDSPYADYARVALADLLTREDATTAEAEALLSDVANQPDSPALGAEALAKAGRLAYRAGRMHDASQRFAALDDKYSGESWHSLVRMDAGWAHLLAGEITLAERASKKGLSDAAEKDRPAWLYLAANIARRDNRHDDAATFYDQLLASTPDRELESTAAYEALELAFAEENFARSLELAPRAYGTKERQPMVLWMQAGALRAMQRHAEALDQYRKIVREFPGSDRAPAASYQMAVIASESGDVAGAAEAFAKTAADYPGSEIAADALMASAALQLKQENPSAAISAWRDLMNTYPSYPQLDEALIGRARAEIQIGNNDDATHQLNRLMTDFPKSRFFAEACFLQATLQEEQNAPEKAESLYQRVLENNPSGALAREAQYRRVAVLQRQGRDADAAALMNNLIASGKADHLPPELIEWLARWNLEQKDFTQASVAAKQLVEDAPSDGWRQLGWYMAGIAAREQNMKGEAMQNFRNAADMALNTRETALAHYELGLFARDDNEPAEAARAFARAAELASSDNAMDIRAKSYLHLGQALEVQGDLAGAVRHFMIVSVLYDDVSVTPESLFRAAGAQDKLGEHKARERSVTELVARYPESDWARQAAERWKKE